MDNPYRTPDTGLEARDPVVFSFVPAPRWRRFLASLIDATIVSLLGVLGGLCLFLHGPDTSDTAMGLGMVSVAVVAYFGLNSHGWMVSGQSLGKRLLGIRIVRKGLEPCSLRRIILLRHAPFVLFSIVPYVGPLVPLIDCILIFRDEPLCLHDDFADTTVVF